MYSSVWLLKGFDTAGETLLLSAVTLRSSAGELSGAIITASHAPDVGSLSALSDGDPSTVCGWYARTLFAPGFFLKFSFATTVEVVAVQLAQASRVKCGVYAGEALVGVAAVWADEAFASGDVAPVLPNAEGGVGLYLRPGESLVNRGLRRSLTLAREGSYTKGTGPQGVATLALDSATGAHGVSVGPVDDLFLEFGSTEDFCVEALIKTSAVVSSDMVFLSHYRGSYVSWQLLVASDGRVRTYESAPNGYVLSDTVSVRDGQWHHVAFVRENEVRKLFVDGRLAATSTGTRIYANTGYPLTIGFQNFLGASNYPFRGEIALVRITRGDAVYKSAFPWTLGVLPSPAAFFGVQASGILTSVGGDLLPQGTMCTHMVQGSQIDAEFGGQGSIYGTVELYAQAGNIPLPRRVRLHRSRDGLLVRETWSNAQGEYRFDGITDRYTYDVIAWDHEGLQQSVVANDLTPEVMP